MNKANNINLNIKLNTFISEPFILYHRLLHSFTIFGKKMIYNDTLSNTIFHTIE